MDGGIRTSWRAALVLGDGERVIHGRARRVGRSVVTVGADHDLRPGHRCTLALILPKEAPGAAGQVVKGKAEVVVSVLTGMQFDITVKWLEMDDYCRRLLDEQLQGMEGR